MLRKSFFLVIVLIGCSPARPSESVNDTIPDSLLVKEYPVEVPQKDTIAQPVFPIDSTYVDYVVENNPETPQLDPTIVYVYKKSGVDLYEVNRDFKIEKVVGHLDYKTKVRLLSALNKDTPLTVDGMKGYYALVQFENKMAYVFTGWLLSMPVPEEASYTLKYFLDHIHVQKAEINRFNFSGDSLEFSANKRFYMESGIVIKDKTQFEDHEYTITIPGMSMQQAWLLGNYFMPGMDIYLKQMPTDSALIRVSQDVYYRVQTKNGKVTSISHENDSGCYSFMSFTEIRGGVEIRVSAGC